MVALSLSRCGALGAVLFAVGGATPAQVDIRRFSYITYDTAARAVPLVKIAAGWSYSAMLRVDGRIFVHGWDNGFGMPGGGRRVCAVPPLPPGVTYVDVEAGPHALAARRSDGVWVLWGTADAIANPPVLPPLPPGLDYVDIALGAMHGAALRSDGQVVMWGSNGYGQLNMPPLPSNVSILDIEASSTATHALLSDGTIFSWGEPVSNLLVPPQLPPGVHYVSLDAGPFHMLAKRSDGEMVAWGLNMYGETAVPPLPPGVVYEKYAAGGTSFAWRSDGYFATWGSQVFDIPTPAAPTSAPCVQLVGGSTHAMALLANGELVFWGSTPFSLADLPAPPGNGDYYEAVGPGKDFNVASTRRGTIQEWGRDYGQVVPTLPHGVRFQRFGAEVSHTLGLTTAGTLLAWGTNQFGEGSVPPLPRGVHYTDVATSWSHTVALRSDGAAVAFGANAMGVCSIPPLPAGVRYVKASAEHLKTNLLRSDGQIVCLGDNSDSQLVVPPLPPERKYVDVAASRFRSLAIRSDGTAVVWGAPIPGANNYGVPIPPLPWGVSYVEAAAGYNHIAIRRSDGQIVVCGFCQYGEDQVTPLEPGTSYLDVQCYGLTTAARYGPQSTYVSFAAGCAGSRPATRLIPRDTPKIGRTLEVTLLDLPHDLALLLLGFSSIAPLPLDGLGMPGCALHVLPDSLVLLAGQNGQAKWRQLVPDQPSLVGLRFYTQALVLDAAAANGAGVVISNAAEGVVGYP